MHLISQEEIIKAQKNGFDSCVGRREIPREIVQPYPHNSRFSIRNMHTVDKLYNRFRRTAVGVMVIEIRGQSG